MYRNASLAAIAAAIYGSSRAMGVVDLTPRAEAPQPTIGTPRPVFYENERGTLVRIPADPRLSEAAAKAAEKRRRKALKLAKQGK